MSTKTIREVRDDDIAVAAAAYRYADAMLAARAEGEPERRETGWLVERGGKWWGPECTERQWLDSVVTVELWTNDANKAVRFARKEDAEAFIRWNGLAGGVMATEHVWVG